jgi:hypothetical protein
VPVCAKCQPHALVNQIKVNIPPDGRQGGAVGIKYAVYNNTYFHCMQHDCKASMHTSLGHVQWCLMWGLLKCFRELFAKNS